MGCNCIADERKSITVTENAHKSNTLTSKTNANNKKPTIVKDNKKLTVTKNYKKEEQKGITILENVKEYLPKDISKENIKEMVYNALGDAIVEEESKFIKGVNITKTHAESIVEALFNIITPKEDDDDNDEKIKNIENIEDDKFKDINVNIGFYEANEENVRRFMFKGKNPTDEQVKNTLNQLTSGDVEAKIFTIELKDE